MSAKTRVAMVFGGKSPEHNISILSCKNVFNAIDKAKYEVVLVYIDKSGRWHYCPEGMVLTDEENPKTISYSGKLIPVYFSQNTDDKCLVDVNDASKLAIIDVFYPVLHGNFGEDGSVQGLAKLANLPCVGCGILGSAVGMDKDIAKRVLRDGGIGIAPFVTLRKGHSDNTSYEEVSKILGSELFIKPATLGSSVGVSFVDNNAAYDEALATAFSYDTKVLVESKMKGREIECAVMGNEHIEASGIGEVLPKTSWYTFENKYVDDDGAKIAIPADLTEAQREKAREVAIETYRLLECRGLTRVDMFLLEDDEVIINEINTLPGFTKISMYPKLWGAAGLAYTDLITKLITLAEEEHARIDGLLSI